MVGAEGELEFEGEGALGDWGVVIGRCGQGVNVVEQTQREMPFQGDGIVGEVAGVGVDCTLVVDEEGGEECVQPWEEQSEVGQAW